VIFPCVMMLILFGETIPQFVHHRSRIMPAFTLPHLVIPIAYTTVATILVPLFVAYVGNESVIKLLAIAAVIFGVMQWISIYAIRIFGFLGLGIVVIDQVVERPVLSFSNLELTTWQYGTLLSIGWLMVIFAFSKLTSLPDDSRLQLSLRVFDECRRQNNRRFKGQSHVSSTKLSDWIDECCVLTIPRPHNGSLYRLIQLLQRGVEMVPAELLATCSAALAIAAWLMVRPDETVVMADPIVSILLILVIATCLIPGFVAWALLMTHRAYFPHQILLPLTRRSLVDGKLLNVAWNTLLLWLSLNAVTLLAIWDFPRFDLSVSLLFTLLLLSFSIAVVLFGVGMRMTLTDSNFVRQVAQYVFGAGTFIVVMFWWFQRDALTDLPFILLAGFALALAGVTIENARRAWTEVEVGRDHV